MSCKCVRCTECGGTGDVWWSFPGPGEGDYLGSHRMDDLDVLEDGGCMDCEGTGIIEMCDECRDAWEDEDYE